VLNWLYEEKLLKKNSPPAPALAGLILGELIIHDRISPPIGGWPRSGQGAKSEEKKFKKLVLCHKTNWNYLNQKLKKN
jgi:hypothetical protein